METGPSFLSLASWGARFGDYDVKARREAKKRGIESFWTLELLDEAAERGLIDDLTETLERLESRTPFYIGEKARVVIEGMKQRDEERKRVNQRQSPE